MIIFAVFAAYSIFAYRYVPSLLVTPLLVMSLVFMALMYYGKRSWQRKARETQAEYEELSARVWVDE